jgi:hypothetical protein
MDIITQEEAKIKIKEWLLLGETDDQIKGKLADYGFVDIVINNLLNEARPITNSSSINSSPTVASVEVPLVTSEVLPQSTEVLSQTPTNISQDNKSESKLKYVIYFLVGFIIPLLGLLIGSLVVIIREKQNKGTKFIVLLLASIFSLFFWNIVLGGVQLGGPTSKTLSQKTAETSEIQLDLSTSIPELNYDVTSGENIPPLTFGNTIISTFITVRITSNNTVTPAEITSVGKQVCSTLTKLQKEVSQVQVEIVQSKSSLVKSIQGMGGTCEEWNSGKI